MKTKKSQITLFIIIALVLFIIIGFFFFLTKYSAKKQTGYSSTESQRIKADLQPIESYVLQCLEKTTKQGLFYMGKQGGYLYKGQNGPLLDYRESDEGKFFVDYDNYDVSYLIYPVRYNLGEYYANAPEYPWITFPFRDETKSENTSKGFFGISNLAPINSSFGANSIKSQMEFFIEKNIQRCIDWSVFEHTYSIKGSMPKVNVGITKEDVSIQMRYSLEITNILTNDVSELEDFSIRIKLRLQKIYDLAYTIINNEINDVEFNVEGYFPGDGFGVDVIRDVINQDDIIRIRDDKSIIDNAPYEFVFARHNRKPAIYYITPLSFIKHENFNVTSDVLVPGYPKSLTASDPDEDRITLDSYYVDTQIPTVPRVKIKDFTGQTLNRDKIDFKIIVTDGEKEDFQIVTAKREEINV